MKIYNLISILFLGAALLTSCAQTEKTEATTAEITAAQMEGRRAAGMILGPEWKDTLQLQRALLDTKVKQSKYIIDCKPQCAEAFDSTFMSTIRSVNPDLANKLKRTNTSE